MKELEGIYYKDKKVMRLALQVENSIKGLEEYDVEVLDNMYGLKAYKDVQLYIGMQESKSITLLREGIKLRVRDTETRRASTVDMTLEDVISGKLESIEGVARYGARLILKAVREEKKYAPKGVECKVKKVERGLEIDGNGSYEYYLKRLIETEEQNRVNLIQKEESSESILEINSAENNLRNLKGLTLELSRPVAFTYIDVEADMRKGKELKGVSKVNKEYMEEKLEEGLEEIAKVKARNGSYVLLTERVPYGELYVLRVK